MSSPQARHWNSTYEDRGARGVSWYQAEPTISLELVEALGISHDAPVIDIGGGASSFARSLVERGFSDVTVLDISRTALAIGEKEHKAMSITKVEVDVLLWDPARGYGVWHDRATFHFLVAERDRVLYLRTLDAALAPGGTAIIATFARDAQPTCSGLPVARYSEEDLTDLLGPSFEVLATRREEHRTPRGVVQPFTWVAARSQGGP
jgi:cyclopropane fatty-acyl-phospholipid synthase-like methyltransferase